MTLSDSISLLLLAFLSVATLRQIILAERATRRQALLTDDVAGCCESVGRMQAVTQQVLVILKWTVKIVKQGIEQIILLKTTKVVMSFPIK